MTFWIKLEPTPDSDGTMYGAQLTILLDPDWMEFSLSNVSHIVEFTVHLSDDQVQDLLELEPDVPN
jgi:hypothetical protein